MTSLNFAHLQSHLPDESTLWNGGASSVVINTGKVTGDTITPESSVLEPITKLLEAVYQLQKVVNSERVSQNLPAIAVINRGIEVSADGNPLYVYSLTVEIDATAALNNLVNPTL